MIPSKKREPAYPANFTGLSSLPEQGDRLRTACHALGLDIDISHIDAIDESIRDLRMPERAEGIALVLRPNLIEGRSDTYIASQLLAQVFQRIDNRFEQDQDYERSSLFRRDERTRAFIDRIIDMQPGDGDVYALPVQLGRRNAKVSDAEAIEAFAPNEFGLSLLAGASILTTHPERIGKPLDLGLSFPGEQYDYEKDGKFSRTIVAKRNQELLLLMHFRPEMEWMNDHGAATGFVWE